MKFGKIIIDYPAYSIHEAVPEMVYHGGERIELPVFRDRDNVDFPFVARFGSYKGQTFWKSFTFGSVVSYTMQYNDDPIEALARAKANGHKLHWLNGNSISITNTPDPKFQKVGLRWDQPFLFEGIIFHGKPAPNDNVELVRLSAAEARAMQMEST